MLFLMHSHCYVWSCPGHVSPAYYPFKKLLQMPEATDPFRKSSQLPPAQSLCYVVNNPFVFQGACRERSLTDSSQGLCGCLQLARAGQAVTSAGSLLSVPRRGRTRRGRTRRGRQADRPESCLLDAHS